MLPDSLRLTRETLHPALNEALSVFPEEIADRAAMSLRRMLEDRIVQDGEKAWSNSFLTGDGFPVEFSFTTADNRLRYTTEPMRAVLAPQRRFEEAVRLLNRLSTTDFPENVFVSLRKMHQQGELLYGAWLGARHGPEDSEYKLYVEVPDDSSDKAVLAVFELELPQPRLTDRTAKLRMVAFTPVSAKWEVYYRIESVQPYHLPRLLAPAGLEGRADEVLRFIADVYGHSLTSRLPGPSVGVSYTMKSPGSAQNVTLFFFARAFWGTDSRIRQRFSRWARAFGWDDSHYQQITTSLADRFSWQTYHGILGITMTYNGQLALNIGVRPIEVLR